MIEIDEGRPTLCGRVTCGFQVGYIIAIGTKTYRIRWIDGNETDQLRPDLNDEDEAFLQAAE